MNKKKKIIVSCILVLFLLVITIGVSFATLSWAKFGTVENIIETGTVYLTYDEGKTGILLENVFPMSDDKGKVLIGDNNVFDFTVEAMIGTEVGINYEITAVKMPLSEEESLQDSEVRLYLEKLIEPETEYVEVMSPTAFIARENETPLGSPVGSMVLDSGIFIDATKKVHHYRLRMWVGENASWEMNGESKKYGVKINVYAKQINMTATDESCFFFNSETETITGFNAIKCTSKDIVIPDTINGVKVTTIGEQAFNTKELTSVVIPNGVTTISASAFLNNKLTSVFLPDSVTTIGVSAFRDNQITNITLGNHVDSIGNLAFKNNYLTKVIFPNSLTTIGTYAFQNNQLTSITIPNSVTTLGVYAFDNNQLTTLKLSNQLAIIGINAFSNNRLTSVTIPDGVTSIQANAFAHNQLTRIDIPDSVTLIVAGAFTDNQMSDDKAFIYFRTASGEIKKTLGSYAGAKRDNIVIPSNIQNISSNAFAGCNLKEITIPSNVISIADALVDNPELTKIINQTGRSFDWQAITGAENAATFVTGIIQFSSTRTITVTDK